MKALQIPTLEEMQAAYRAGEGSVVAVYGRLVAVIAELAERVTTLEKTKNSGNSSQPPSSDGLKKTTKRSLRGKSGKKSGGQAGHAGRTLKAVNTPDAVVVHAVVRCACCQAGLEGVASSRVEKRQVFDLPAVVLAVTEHQAEHKVCPACGAANAAAFPSEVAHAVQYGPRFRAQLVYFHSGQFIPLARTAEMVEGLYGQPVAEGTIVAAVTEAAQAVAPVNAAVRTYLAQTPEAVHSDETGARVEGKLHWVHTAGTPQATLYAISPKRGSVGIETLGVLNHRQGPSVHDGWQPYFKYPVQHGLCNAHHLRELTGIAEQGQQPWAAELRHLLAQANTTVGTAQAEGRSALTGEQVYWIEHRYDTLLDRAEQALGLDPPPDPPPKRRVKHSPAANLVRRLRLNKTAVLAFVNDFAVPFDNNLAERDIRMVKVQQKVSGGFRSEAGATAFVAVRSYLSTARKNGLSMLSALTQAFHGNPFFPPCAVPTK